MKQYIPERSPKIRKVIESPPNMLVRYGTILIIVIFTITLLLFFDMLSLGWEIILDNFIPKIKSE